MILNKKFIDKVLAIQSFIANYLGLQCLWLHYNICIVLFLFVGNHISVAI
jgi:hypothetical protein